MRYAGILLTFALLLPASSNAALMAPGDIAFIGFNADGSDDFAFVTLVDINPNTTVYFSDNEWNGNPIGGTGAFVDQNEGSLSWLSGATSIAAGSVVSVTSASNVSRTVNFGSITVAAGALNLDTIGDALYAYLGTNHDAPTAFLSVIATSAAQGNLGNTGLMDNVSAQIIDSPPNFHDIMAYTGPRSGQASFANYLGIISTDTNWIFEGGASSQHNNSIAPDVPFDTTSFTESQTAVPEPSALLLACGGLLTLASARRRRSS